jgi:hypothetical protein
MLNHVNVDWNNPGNGYTHTWTYDVNGYVLTLTEDAGSDGVLDFQEAYYYQCY